jgi:dTDP-D-glucose 4,6-dehydratase
MYGRSLYFDTTRARSELGWQPKYSNSEMLVQSYDWYLQNHDNLSTASASHHRSPVKQGVLGLLKRLL